MSRTELIEKILQIAGDYRKGEIITFDAKHIEKWVEQFPLSKEHQNVILKEVGHLLEGYYISRNKAKSNLIRLFNVIGEQRLAGCGVQDVNFLRMQDDGKSQHEILLLADEILDDMHGIKVHDCGGSKNYLYLDDCVYSGNKWRYDIEKSTQLLEAGEGITLVSIHFSIYNDGFNYARGYIEKCLARRMGKLKPFRTDAYESCRFAGRPLDIMWPVYVAGNKQIDAYAQYVRQFCIENNWSAQVMFRTNQVFSPNLFTSTENQHIVEQAFLAVGAKMFCAAQNPARSMRPMGFQVLATIGFGTPIITWRNIANNCPLALWYGDPSFGPAHPLGQWYPLFPRKM